MELGNQIKENADPEQLKFIRDMIKAGIFFRYPESESLLHEVNLKLMDEYNHEK